MRYLTAAVIPAAGAGRRMGAEMPKQFMDISGEPMLFHSVWTFAAHDGIDEIVIVTGREYIGYCEDYIASAPEEKKRGKKITVTEGGGERYESVKKGLDALGPEIRYVLVHDGARPYVTAEVISRVIEAMKRTGAAIPCVAPKDTIRTRERVLDRSLLYCVQTPQGFRKDILAEAIEDGMMSGFLGTDDASFVENMGITPEITEGDYGNIKITTKEDLPVEMRIGHGYDVHRFREAEDPRNSGVTLGGVFIPYEKELEAHSDGDVLLHAVTDALLGAAAMGDIGKLFPDTDPAYENIDSVILLREAAKRLAEKGYRALNVDATIIAQAPKVSAFTAEMAAKIAAALGIEDDRVSVKATTTERLGFTGRKEGIAAEAVCLIGR